MVKLSEQLADLSVHAKNAEDAVAAAQKEAHDEIVARKEQARAAVTNAIDKVNQDLKSAGDTTARNFSAVKAKIDADISALKANVAQAKHKLDAKRAVSHAERLEWEAGVAIELQLSHAKKNKVAASYDYAKYIPQRTELMQWWADYLEVGLKTEKAKVVAIRKHA